VARLQSGDLSVYSAVAEQVCWLDRRGIPWTMTPGGRPSPPPPPRSAAADRAGRAGVVLTGFPAAPLDAGGRDLAASRQPGRYPPRDPRLDRIVTELTPVLGRTAVAIVVRATAGERPSAAPRRHLRSLRRAGGATAMISSAGRSGEDFRESSSTTRYQRRFRGR
jgi:precorrin-4/cobalt-precorrin-4 C11-methyltransferase